MLRRWVQTAVFSQSTWNWCPQGGSLRTSSPCLKGTKQTTQSSIRPPSTLSSRTIRGKESTADSTAASCASMAAIWRRSSACTDLSWDRRWRKACPKEQARMQRTTERPKVGSAQRPVESIHRVIGKLGGGGLGVGGGIGGIGGIGGGSDGGNGGGGGSGHGGTSQWTR